MAGVIPASWGLGSVGIGAAPGTISGPRTPTKPTPTTKPPVVSKPKPKPAKPKVKPKPKPKKKKPSALDKYLAGDTDYQTQLAEYKKSEADYNANYNTQVSRTNRDYNNTKRQLTLQGQKDRMDQQDDFAGRGILHSGVFAKALADYNTDYNTQMQNLVTGNTDRIGDLKSQRTQFLNQLGLNRNAARQDAIRRRAAKLGI